MNRPERRFLAEIHEQPDQPAGPTKVTLAQ
jgi:hypothetical protein